jgi:hypothetical protein
LRYHSGAAWNKAFEMYSSFGRLNGLHLDPPAFKKLQMEAQAGGANSDAAQRLQRMEHYRNIVGFDNFIRQTNVERTPEAVAARKAIFEVKSREEEGERSPVQIYHDKVLPLWLDLLLRYPEFRQIESIQDETYELQAAYFEKLQRHPYLKTLFSTWAKASAFGVLPWPNCPEFIKPPAVFYAEVKKKDLKVLPIVSVEGLLDTLYVLDGPGVETIKPMAQVLARQVLWPPVPKANAPDFAFARFVVWPAPGGVGAATPEIGLGQQWTWPPPRGLLTADNAAAAAGAAGGAAVPPPLFLMLSSAEQRRILTQLSSRRGPAPGQGWTPLVPMTVIQRGKLTIRWMQVQRPAAPTEG